MENLNDQISRIKSEFEKDTTSLNKDDLYLKYFSKVNGLVTLLTKEIPKLSIEDKKIFGPLINQLKTEIEQKIAGIDTGEQINLDETIKIKHENKGHLHPTTETILEMNNFFRYHGFSIYDGPEIETEEYNFRKLNLPENHPATDLQDSLYISSGILLRTHTSSVETRALTDQKPPIRIVIPGKVFRNETLSATNSSFFYQYQGVVVDKNITIKNLVQTLIDFHRYLFGEDVVTRIRYKYYPEVSPGLGADIRCRFCEGDGCSVCKYRGYVEVLGSGMIHYNTLKMCGINPEEYTGFAFGMGLDRLVMQKYKISDIRKLYGGSLIYK
jgi:phenylalanyl-tRNA synthetase alpha chain